MLQDIVRAREEAEAESSSPLSSERAPHLPQSSEAASPLEGIRRREMAREPVVLRLRHLGKSYPIAGTNDRVVALKDIHLCEPEGGDAPPQAGADGRTRETFGPIRRGEFIMIRGPSGGGKTTLLNIIGTIDSCTEGSVELLGEIIDEKAKEGHLADVRLRTLGFVFQTFNLISTMSAAENVELPMTLMGKLSEREIRLRARQLLTLVGLRNRVNHLPSELSGGEQQRVTIARSLANNPVVLLLDEPTGDLDTINTIDVMDLLIRINRSTKTTCIMVTHNPDVECYADRILYVADGRFVREVHNSSPSRLNADAYAKYLEEKERETTQITHWDNRDDGVRTSDSSSPAGPGSPSGRLEVAKQAVADKAPKGAKPPQHPGDVVLQRQRGGSHSTGRAELSANMRSESFVGEDDDTDREEEREMTDIHTTAAEL